MQITANKVVSINYKLTNAEGELLDASHPDAPLSYLHGANNIIGGLESALEGKVAGDKLDVAVAPADGYGERHDDMVQEVPREACQDATDIQPGMQFQAEGPSGAQIVTVTEVTETHIKVDGNHPLAGQTLHFAVEVTEVREPSSEELEHGHVHGEHCAHD
jgi:FKBP-type peptidyl-prolyl cis-trans isomerase SlyD